AYDVLLTQERTLLATQARLEGGRIGKDAPVFPTELRGDDPQSRSITEDQVQIFLARKELMAARKRVWNKRIEQLGEQINGYRAEVESASQQLVLIAKEIEAKSVL